MFITPPFDFSLSLTDDTLNLSVHLSLSVCMSPSLFSFSHTHTHTHTLTIYNKVLKFCYILVHHLASIHTPNVKLRSRNLELFFRRERARPPSAAAPSPARNNSRRRRGPGTFRRTNCKRLKSVKWSNSEDLNSAQNKNWTIGLKGHVLGGWKNKLQYSLKPLGIWFWVYFSFWAFGQSQSIVGN